METKSIISDLRLVAKYPACYEAGYVARIGADCIEQQEKQIGELKAELEKVKAERDVAVECLKKTKNCEYCAHGHEPCSEPFGCGDCSRVDCPCFECVNGSGWKWRGLNE